MTPRTNPVITDEFCVMTPNGPHHAYSIRATVRETQEAIKFDGGPDLFVGCRTRTVITSAWEPIDFGDDYEPVQ